MSTHKKLVAAAAVCAIAAAAAVAQPASAEQFAPCSFTDCPNSSTQLCATVNATINGFGVVYYCYQPVVKA